MTNHLIHRVLNGETDAFRHIIRDYKDDIYTLAISLVNDEITARDVVQSSFIKAYDKLSTFRGQSKFSTWLYRIVYNESMQTLRKQQRRMKLFEPALDPETEEAFVADREIFTELEEEDHRRFWINEALSRIPPKEALALRLFYLMEHPIKEITSITGWSESATKGNLHRGRNHVKQVLSEECNMGKEDLY